MYVQMHRHIIVMIMKDFLDSLFQSKMKGRLMFPIQINIGILFTSLYFVVMNSSAVQEVLTFELTFE